MSVDTTKFWARNAVILPPTARSKAAEGQTDTEETFRVRWTTGATVVRYGFTDEGFEAFEEVLEVPGASLDRLNAGAPLLDSHRSRAIESVIGSVVPGSASIDGTDGYADVRLSAAPSAADAATKIREGSVRSVSVGYSIDAYRWERQKNALSRLVVSRWTPLELSAVPIPADAGAQFLRALGAPTGGKMSEETSAVVPPVAQIVQPDLSALRAEERARVRYCEEFAARQGLPREVSDEIIARGLPQADTISALWDEASKRSAASGPTPSGISITRDAGDTFGDAARAAVLCRLAESLPTEALRGVVATSEDRAKAGQYLRAPSAELAREALQYRGVRLDKWASHRELICTAADFHGGAAILAGSRAMNKTDLPGIFVDAINVAVIRLTKAAPADWLAFCQQYNPKTHGTIHLPMLGAIGLLQSVTTGQESPNLSFGDSKETAETATYTGTLELDMDMLADDQYGDIARLVQGIGAAIPDTRENTVFAVVATNPTMSDSVAFYHSSHGNLASSGAAPTAATLGDADDAMYAQTGVNGQALAIRPSVFLGSSATCRTVEQLLGRTVTPAIPTSLSTPVAESVGAGIQKIIRHPLLTGNAWYLMAGGLSAPIVYGSPQNNLVPQVVSEYDARRRQQAITVTDQFYAAAIVWRGAYKNTGA